MEEPFTSWIVPELCPSVSMPLNMNLFAFSLYVGSPGKEDVCSVGLLPEAVSVLLSTLVQSSQCHPIILLLKHVSCSVEHSMVVCETERGMS
jgi:hypothetical protein